MNRLTASERRHDVDAVRTGAFALLILYHVGMVYVADWGFHIKSPSTAEWLQWPMVAINRWRMPLIFLVSGLALGLSALALRPGRMALRRTSLLLVPLIFGMLAIVPIQAWVEARTNGAFETGFGAFMLRYLRLKPWPGGGFAGAEFGVTWNHLWYLAYLWTYTLVLAAGMAFHRAIRTPNPAQTQAPIGRIGIACLVTLPVLWWFFVLYGLEPRFGDTKALLDDWAQHAKYFPVFLFGFFLARRRAWWTAVREYRRIPLVLALTGLGVYMALRFAGRALSPEEVAALPDLDWRAISDSAHALYAWNALLAILGYAAAWLNRPRRWMPYANRAVYPWYILHQSLIVPLAALLIPLSLPGPAEAMLVLTGTIAGCAVIHHFVLLRVRWLQPPMGMQIRPEPARPPRGRDSMA
ncbi:MAG: acyltransferase family protein [Gammaproteobacteria bacterium]|jgi:hypothetical protein|nr:acyltransferase family protein [Gammaproteobacteria bacterium]